MSLLECPTYLINFVLFFAARLIQMMSSVLSWEKRQLLTILSGFLRKGLVKFGKVGAKISELMFWGYHTTKPFHWCYNLQSLKLSSKCFLATMPHHTIPYHIMPCHATPYHLLCHAIPYHNIKYLSILHHTLPYPTTTIPMCNVLCVLGFIFHMVYQLINTTTCGLQM